MWDNPLLYPSSRRPPRFFTGLERKSHPFARNASWINTRDEEELTLTVSRHRNSVYTSRSEIRSISLFDINAHEEIVFLKEMFFLLLQHATPKLSATRIQRRQLMNSVAGLKFSVRTIINWLSCYNITFDVCMRYCTVHAAPDVLW